MWGPRIQGRVVLLRPIAEQETQLTLKWFGDPEILRLLGPGLSSISPAAEHEWWEQAGTDRDAFHWGLDYEGRLVGSTSIMGIDWTSRNADTGTVIGDRSAWGKGVARETMQLRADFAFRQLNLHKLLSGWFEPNVASGRAQASAGYRVIGRARDELWRDGTWHDLVLTELMRSDWEAAH